MRKRTMFEVVEGVAAVAAIGGMVYFATMPHPKPVLESVSNTSPALAPAQDPSTVSLVPVPDAEPNTRALPLPAARQIPSDWNDVSGRDARSVRHDALPMP